MVASSSKVPPQPSLYGSAVNYGGNRPWVIFLLGCFPARSDSSSLSLTSHTHICVCIARCTAHSLLFNLPNLEELPYLELTQNYSLRWKGKELGGLGFVLPTQRTVLLPEQLIHIEKCISVCDKWKWTLEDLPQNKHNKVNQRQGV